MQACIYRWNLMLTCKGSTVYPESVIHLVYPRGNMEKAMAPTPVLVPGKSMDGEAWQAAVHGVAKSQT